MYNRYVPQADGSYTRNRMPDASNQRRPSPPPRPKPQPEKEHCPPPEPECPRREKPHHKENTGLGGGFLRQLLPADFDTGDLIVVLLLLLMAGDCEEDRNNAILTIALYFLM